ncbi:anti-sigma factor family protein [Kitasatospora viridis]|uniref:Putative zinc finger protein n=1 Tax=Kitasatospora viridis TaxID=281105 RepID=A0A561UHI2_9ACTN|nr:zf-HC2 domain-containing protein [Kitasatospora viridis]TWF98814.1 putative zinc finger protein [Kitasatospora viridis]
MTTPSPHESSADPRHPSVEQLADLAEDLLPADRAAAVRTHLADCPECADTTAALTELTALLAADPIEPMPQEVARRIDAALAAAQPSTPTAPITPPTPAAPTVPGAPAAPLSPGAPPARADRSTRAAGRPGRRRRFVLAAAACLAVFGLGGGLLLSQQSASRPAASAVSTSTPDTATHPAAGTKPTGPEFTAAGLPDQVRALLRPSALVQPHTTTEQGETGNLPPDCVQLAIPAHQGEVPLLTAHGSYQGSAVDVYVFRAAGDPESLDAYLVAPGCSTAPAVVELHQQVPAH